MVITTSTSFLQKEIKAQKTSREPRLQSMSMARVRSRHDAGGFDGGSGAPGSDT